MDQATGRDVSCAVHIVPDQVLKALSICLKYVMSFSNDMLPTRGTFKEHYLPYEQSHNGTLETQFSR